MDEPDPDDPITATVQEAWAALRMIRVTIETLGPVGALISQEAVLQVYGPQLHDEAQAICDGLARILDGGVRTAP